MGLRLAHGVHSSRYADRVDLALRGCRRLRRSSGPIPRCLGERRCGPDRRRCQSGHLRAPRRRGLRCLPAHVVLRRDPTLPLERAVRGDPVLFRWLRQQRRLSRGLRGQPPRRRPARARRSDRLHDRALCERLRVDRSDQLQLLERVLSGGGTDRVSRGERRRCVRRIERSLCRVRQHQGVPCHADGCRLYRGRDRGSTLHPRWGLQESLLHQWRVRCNDVPRRWRDLRCGARGYVLSGLGLPVEHLLRGGGHHVAASVERSVLSRQRRTGRSAHRRDSLRLSGSSARGHGITAARQPRAVPLARSRASIRSNRCPQRRPRDTRKRLAHGWKRATRCGRARSSRCWQRG